VERPGCQSKVRNGRWGVENESYWISLVYSYRDGNHFDIFGLLGPTSNEELLWWLKVQLL